RPPSSTLFPYTTLFRSYANISGNIGGKTLPLSLLVDSGSGDALWLFENEEGINLPEENFHDFLGYGISGSIYGSRSRIGEINFGKYQLPDRKSTRLNSSHVKISYAVFCLKKKKRH